MPKTSPKKPAPSPKLEFEPDAWERFESLIRSAAKMGPRPHDGSSPKARATTKKKASKAKK